MIGMIWGTIRKKPLRWRGYLFARGASASSKQTSPLVGVFPGKQALRRIQFGPAASSGKVLRNPLNLEIHKSLANW